MGVRETTSNCHHHKIFLGEEKDEQMTECM